MQVSVGGRDCRKFAAPVFHFDSLLNRKKLVFDFKPKAFLSVDLGSQKLPRQISPPAARCTGKS